MEIVRQIHTGTQIHIQKIIILHGQKTIILFHTLLFLFFFYHYLFISLIPPTAFILIFFYILLSSYISLYTHDIHLQLYIA